VADRRHAQRAGGRDVVVDAVADHDAVGGRHVQRGTGGEESADRACALALPLTATVEMAGDPGRPQAVEAAAGWLATIPAAGRGLRPASSSAIPGRSSKWRRIAAMAAVTGPGGGAASPSSTRQITAS
jgi:hypothetical protein